ncbi:MAG: hypothetical protein J0M30_12030 [Chitinophagales bacterium]|nr:hypothetical protein [Chitinophagales bacterium]
MSQEPLLPSSFDPDPSPDNGPEEQALPFPPRPVLDDQSTNVWVKSLSSLALYLVVGYVIFQDWKLLLIITGIVIFHELGHFLAMKVFNYKELGIFFIPLLGAYASGTKHEVSQRQAIIILLAGPLPGILLGIVMFLFQDHFHHPLLPMTATLLLFLNLLNLLPIYPLDGGQILHRLFLDEKNIIGRTFMILSALFMIWFDWSYIYPSSLLAFVLLLYFPINILLRLKADIDNDKLIKKIEADGVDLNVDYEEISDEGYWKMRNVFIKHHPDLKDIPPAPPYQYANREDKVITTMQGMLQRLIIMDLSIVEKIAIILLWIGCFAAPILMHLKVNLFQTL